MYTFMQLSFRMHPGILLKLLRRSKGQMKVRVVVVRLLSNAQIISNSIDNILFGGYVTQLANIGRFYGFINPIWSLKCVPRFTLIDILKIMAVSNCSILDKFFDGSGLRKSEY